ncbi:MAG TPA: hypothetical protein VG406_08010 [Isosphaeraceae bacterium]|nr:hypothetical protein [Isosphaeraceae bacterium]
MSIGSIHNIQSSWNGFLVDAELAKHYQMANMLAAGGHLPAPNPILEALLPSLLYVRLGALVDDALEQFISMKGLVMPGKYRTDFNGRITFLDDQGYLKDANKIHNLRKRRNELAHEASRSCSWVDLDEATNVIDAELQHLELSGPRPAYEFYAERQPREQAEPGYLMSMDYSYGLKVGGHIVAEVRWTKNLSGPSTGQSQ